MIKAIFTVVIENLEKLRGVGKRRPAAGLKFSGSGFVRMNCH